MRTPARSAQGSVGTFGQCRQSALQSCRKFAIHKSNLAKQALDYNSKSAAKFLGVQPLDKRSLELGRDIFWQTVHSAAMSSRKTVPNADQCKSVVARAAYHVFRAP